MLTQTHTLDIVLTVANIPFAGDLLCSNTLKSYIYAYNCHLFEVLSLYNLAVEIFVLMLTKLAIELSRNIFFRSALNMCLCCFVYLSMNFGVAAAIKD